jgi:hypothetical protein
MEATEVQVDYTCQISLTLGPLPYPLLVDLPSPA